MTAEQFVEFAVRLRSLGAASVRAGDFGCEWGPQRALFTPPDAEQETVSPPDVAEAEAQAEHDRLLFWSSEG